MDRYLEREIAQEVLAQSLSQDASASLSLFDRRGKHLKYTLQVDIIVLCWHFSFQLQLSMYPPPLAPLFRTCETSNPTSKGGPVKHDTATTRALIITPIRHHCTRVWDVRCGTRIQMQGFTSPRLQFKEEGIVVSILIVSCYIVPPTHS